MNLKNGPFIIVPILLLLLSAACSMTAKSTPSPEPVINQDSSPQLGIPIGLPTYTLSEPANINLGKFIGTVYISDKDQKFHRSDCLNLSPASAPLPRQQAIIQGYTACPVCNP